MRRKPSKVFWLGVAVMPLAFVLPTPRLYISLTPSMPRGIYLSVPLALVPGVIVVECLPLELATFGKERGYLHDGNCPGHAISVLKRIVGVPGDTIELGDTYVAIDGTLRLDGFLVERDFKGREIPKVARQTFTLGAGEYFLLGTHPRSWDNRYTGLTYRENIIDTVVPVLTEGTHDPQ